MEISKNFNKKMDLLFATLLLTALLLLTAGNILVYATVPILFAIVFFVRGAKEFFACAILAALLGFIFMDKAVIAYNLGPLALITLIFIGLARSSLSDKSQIFIGFILISAISIISYKLVMIENGMSINSMAKTLYDDLLANTNYDLGLEYIEATVALYPAILASLAMVYSIFGQKVVRNYLNYKDLGKDMAKLNTIRLEKNDFFLIIISSIIIYFVLVFLGIKEIYVLTNLIWIGLMILIFNGMSAYDYLMNRRQSLLSRGLQWFFVIILFYLFAIFFMILGLLDIFIDIRNKTRRAYGQI